MLWCDSATELMTCMSANDASMLIMHVSGDDDLELEIGHF